MDATTREIEQQQNALLDQMRAFRVMRRGTLSHQEYPQRRTRKQGTGASGPYFVWQGFRSGKHFSKRVSAQEAEQVKYEIETRRQFERLCEEYVRLGEALATREGARTKQDESPKKRAQVALETSKEINRILAVVQRKGQVDLEAVENALRCALLQAGARLLETLLERVGVGRRAQPARCRCGARMESRGCKTKTLVTVLGKVRFTRSLFQCPRCGKTRFPGDAELGVVDTSRSPGVQRLVARFAAQEPFEAAADDLREAAGIALSVKDVERIAERLGEEIRDDENIARREQRRQVEAGDLIGVPVDTLYVEFDGTGIPMVPAAVKDRPGKQPDGTAKTREAKLGCVFTQTAFDADGRPIRDHATTSFVGQIEDADACGRRMYDEAVRRGLYWAKRVVVVTDGAEWIRNQVALHFSQATHIIDFYHAREHVARLAKLLFTDHPNQAPAYDKSWGDLLKEGRVDEIVLEARTLLAEQHRNPDKDTENEIGYLDKNRDRMHYDQYRLQGLFVGSGVIEAGCRHVIGQRFKQSGMFWSERGANNIVSLRCCMLSNRFEDFWANRAEKRPITRAAA